MQLKKEYTQIQNYQNLEVGGGKQAVNLDRYPKHQFIHSRDGQKSTIF